MDEAMNMPASSLPAGGNARDWSSLPPLLLLADGFATGRAGLSAGAVQEHVVALVEAGVRAVQFRDHAAEPAAFARAATALAGRLRVDHPDLTLIINGHPGLARQLGALLHIGHRGPTVAEARRLIGEDTLLSYSAHSPNDARSAVAAGADVLLVSPLFRTVSHPHEEPGEVDLLRRTCEALADVWPAPCVYALGGITPGHVAACLAAGAHGVAVLSGLLEAPDPEAAARAYLGAFP